MIKEYKNSNHYTAIDLFAGCGGLSEGLEFAGFNVVAACEKVPIIAEAYALNHPHTKLYIGNIKDIDPLEIMQLLPDQELHLLAGCPPCQGFSSVRRLNRKKEVFDERNSLINEYLRFVTVLNPETIMMENVPGLIEYELFKSVCSKLEKIGYNLDIRIVDISNYQVPQRRKRLVVLGSRLGDIKIAPPIGSEVTVQHTIEHLPPVDQTDDPLHQIYPRHTPRIQKMISLIPKDGGSRNDLPEEYKLECHKKDNVGFNDIYGRLSWKSVSSTITGGCLNPSKGRFLHPEYDRCITAREAALLQTFKPDRVFPDGATKADIALMIGNALPPKFSKIQGDYIREHLNVYHDRHIHCA